MTKDSSATVEDIEKHEIDLHTNWEWSYVDVCVTCETWKTESPCRGFGYCPTQGGATAADDWCNSWAVSQAAKDAKPPATINNDS